jgi:hypothetical protein
MVSTEVKRTIVKSPPELWEQLSDQETLMRHLGEFGEIRITRSEPEKIVEWETDQAHGKVQMKPSGWGTQVLLSVTRELPEKDHPPAEASPAAEKPTLLPIEEELEPAEDIAEPQSNEPTQQTPADAPSSAAESTPQAKTPDLETQDETSTSATEPMPAQEEQAEASISAEPPPRRGFFARLFKRRRDQAAQDPADASQPAPTSLETEQLTDPIEHAATENETPILEQQTPTEKAPDPQQTATDCGEQERNQRQDPVEEAAAEPVSETIEEDLNLAAELAQAEELLSEQTAVVLTSMLDRLGAAHHRPFSRG